MSLAPHGLAAPAGPPPARRVNNSLNGTAKGDHMAQSASNPAIIYKSGQTIIYSSDHTVILNSDQGWGITGEPGDAVLIAGAGDDMISWVGNGAHFTDAGDGNDVISTDGGDQTVLGGAGNDAIYGSTGAQLLSGGDGADYIWCGAGSQTVLGGAGGDVIYTHGGTLAFGEGGNDKFFAYHGADTVSGGAGNDLFVTYARRSDTAPQVLDGGAGDDLFYAGYANATLTGGGGRDTFALHIDAYRQLVVTDFRAGQDMVQFCGADDWFGPPPSDWNWRTPAPVAPPPSLTMSAAPGPGGDAVLHFGHGATVTLLGVPAARVEAHLGDYVKPG